MSPGKKYCPANTDDDDEKMATTSFSDKEHNNSPQDSSIVEEYNTNEQVKRNSGNDAAEHGLSFPQALEVNENRHNPNHLEQFAVQATCSQSPMSQGTTSCPANPDDDNKKMATTSFSDKERNNSPQDSSVVEEYNTDEQVERNSGNDAAEHSLSFPQALEENENLDDPNHLLEQLAAQLERDNLFINFCSFHLFMLERILRALEQSYLLGSPRVLCASAGNSARRRPKIQFQRVHRVGKTN